MVTFVAQSHTPHDSCVRFATAVADGHAHSLPGGLLWPYLGRTIRPVSPVLSLPPLYVYTAATFIRRKLVDDGVLYDDSYKDIADLEWIVRLVREGYKLAHVRQYYATFHHHRSQP